MTCMTHSKSLYPIYQLTVVSYWAISVNQSELITGLYAQTGYMCETHQSCNKSCTKIIISSDITIVSP